ncbi:MAG: 1-deoxy-D-xylulose-5-phosphate reductoisomerase [Clostridia bacterium]|nr:1-deoxy-D-xylulose-5-phosphate reductoisomerase [Clostridia bacterium]
MQKKTIAVFGSTGSIGTQTLSAARAHADVIRVEALAANTNVRLVSEQIKEFRPSVVGMYDEAAAKALSALHPELEVVSGKEVDALAALSSVDTVVNGVSGFAGLFPLLSALGAGKTVALANKESIVCGHKVVDRALKAHGGRLLPVDSEQSAIFQCLAAGRREDVSSLILTASGGMFRDLPKEELRNVTPEMALRHPTWSMGRKITVDSSTLFNKGLEIMEAGWLFGFSPDEVRVFIHPQSVVHSMVEYRDGSVIAQMAKPDMRLAIQYAITYPERMDAGLGPVTPALLSGLAFFEPDTERFPAVALAYEAFRDGESLPIAYNSANEVAVARFLEGGLGFDRIADCVRYAMEHISRREIGSVSDILYLDGEARALAEEYCRAGFSRKENQ